MSDISIPMHIQSGLVYHDLEELRIACRSVNQLDRYRDLSRDKMVLATVHPCRFILKKQIGIEPSTVLSTSECYRGDFQELVQVLIDKFTPDLSKVWISGGWYVDRVYHDWQLPIWEKPITRGQSKLVLDD